MRIDAARVIELRKASAWSQDELAIAAGLHIRTIQRIEREGSASLQSKKALAAAFEVDVGDLDHRGSEHMTYEYKTVSIKFSFGLFKKGTANVDQVLNDEAADGWRFKQMIVPADATGGSEQMVAILERAKPS